MVVRLDYVSAVLFSFFVSRVRPPISCSLARCRNHARDQHEEVHGHSVADEWRRERTEGLRDHDQIGPTVDRFEDRVRELRQLAESSSHGRSGATTS